MELTSDEKEILDGKKGDMLAGFMKLLVAIGEAFDAPRMIPVSSVHITSVSLNTLREAGKRLIDEIAESGEKFRAFTTINPLATDVTHWQALGISDHEAKNQFEVADAMLNIGAISCNTCTPYLVGNIPRYGEHIAWGEASAVIFANSAIGARTNPEGGPSGLASALTGKTPFYGLHLNENRTGQFLVRVRAPLNELTEYGALCLFGGRAHKDLIPVFKDTPKQISWDELKMMSAILHSVNSSKIFHIVGVTPDALTEQQALGGKPPSDIVDFGPEEMELTIQSLDKAETSDVDWVTIGCPHCSIGEIREVVRLLDGKKINANVAFWVSTSQPVHALADRMGFTSAIERAGGRIVSDTCPVLLTQQTVKNLGFRSLTTNSAELAFVMPQVHGVKAHFGRLNKCIAAAISGTWR